MEKVVTKIGDVTIERRISKPRVSLETSIENNLQQTIHPLLKIPSGLPMADDMGKLLNSSPSTFKAEHISIQKVSKPASKSFIPASLKFGEGVEIKLNTSSKKPVAKHPESIDLSNVEISKLKENVQNIDSNYHNISYEVSEDSIREDNESGVSLPKVQKIDEVQKRVLPSFAAANPIKNEPDLSKFVGISIERKKRVSSESHSCKNVTECLPQPQFLSPDISIKRIPSRGSSYKHAELNFKPREVVLDNELLVDKDSIDKNASFHQSEEILEKNEEHLVDSPSERDLIDVEVYNKSKIDEVVVQDDVEDKKLDKDVEEIEEEEEEEEEEDDDEVLPLKEDEDFEKDEIEEEFDTKESEISDFACTDLVELMQKGEIEGEIEDVKDEDDEIMNASEEKEDKKRKAENDIVEEMEYDEDDDHNGDDDDEGEENRDEDENENEIEKNKEKDEKKNLKRVKKKRKTENKDVGNKDRTDEEMEGTEEKDKNLDKSKITNANLRKNIREVMDETKLDEATLAAQRQEAERLKRLQEQQRIIREVQRQIALNRQNQKSQNKVLSLLQGNSQTSILKTSSASTQAQNSQTKSQNSVLVKLSNGEQTSLNKKMMELLKNSKNKTILGSPPITKTLLKQGMVTPSVSIAPIVKKEKEPMVEEKKKKKGDVVTLSSDSEDDCIVLSDEDESEPEEDPTNSGMHTNDKYNFPDEQGRVIVNVGHPESESDLYLAPQIAKIIKPHQIGGIRFLYDNVIESVDRFSTSAGFGCILAHSMGLGKTLQIVSFSDIFLRYTSARTILCIMPINTIQNWLAEFNMWLPKESSSDEVRCREFDLFIVNESLKNINARAKVILDWQKSGGVLLMGYELFRLLSLKKSYKSKKKKKNIEEDIAKHKELIEEVYSALVLPGPDLVICDEGHRIKNSHATTSQALKQIRTKRRIVLTGYPLQNNLLEYWCMVDFVRPNYLGTKTEFSNMFERPIQNGQCIDSTPQDKRLMRYRAHVLHSLLEGFVQRRSHAVLQSTLPEKEEYVLLLRFTPFQRKLYDTFMNEVVRTVAVPNPLKAFAVCCKIWNHPDVLYNFLKKKGEEIDLDLEEALPPSLQTPQFPFMQQPLGARNNDISSWPQRGPGSRGGKSRQHGPRNIKSRKPAAPISPNISAVPDKTDTFGSSQFSGNENFPSKRVEMDNFRGRNFNQNQFGFGSEYNSQSSYSSSNSNSSFSKNPLNNLENMSVNNFQTKRYFPQPGDAGNQGQYGNSSHNFNSVQNSSFNQNSSNDSNLNSRFDSNLNSSESSYTQVETKPFQYNQDFTSDYFPTNNFQNSGSINYSEDKNRGFRSNSPYYQSLNPNFRSSENFNYQSGSNLNSGSSFSSFGRSSSNFRNSMQLSDTSQRLSGNLVSNFQNSSRGTNFRENNSGSNSNYSVDFACNETNFTGIRQNRNFEMNQNCNFQGPSPDANYQSANYGSSFWSQSNWNYGESSKSNADFQNKTTGSDFVQQDFNSFEKGQTPKVENKNFDSGNSNSAMYNKVNCDYGSFEKTETDAKKADFDENKGTKPKEENDKKEEAKPSDLIAKKEDASLPYDWATDLFKTYVTGVIENSSKMEVFFQIVTESIKIGDRLLVFSQSLLTLDLIEDYLHRQNVPNKEEAWVKNKNYFRLDGSTPGLEREKLINEFNGNSSIHLFLVSTRAGSLGINLVGANRVVVFDASWNPCHDTQAVCRVYRYGQSKPCFVYRLVMDSCLEKKIYDRQVNKQGMADRVVDELNPDAHLSIKEVTNLCWDDQEDTAVKDFSHLKEKYNDEIIKILLDRCSKLLSKEPFQHESLLIDRKEKKLSQAEKRLAKRSYELEKQAANQPKNIYSFFPNAGQRNFVKPIASVRPMQSEMGSRISSLIQNRSKWIPAEVWQKQGMSAQEMTLPLDVVIPTSSPDKTSIVLKAGQRVMVLKSPKGIYMQLENGKIIAIRSAFKIGQNGPGSAAKQEEVKKESGTQASSSIKPQVSPSTINKGSQPFRQGLVKQPFLKPFTKVPEKKVPMNMHLGRARQVMGKAKPFFLNRKYESVTPEIKQKLMSGEVSFNNQEDKFHSGGQTALKSTTQVDEKNESKAKEESFLDKKTLDCSEEKTENKANEKPEIADSLETLRKVTEKIANPSKREEEVVETQFSPMKSLKNYQHNFTSQIKGDPPCSDSENKEQRSEKEENKSVGKSQIQQHQQQGSDGVQNWLTNQSYPPVDPYGNFFPGYYAYGPGPAPMMSPYDGFYPPNNFTHSVARNSSIPPSGSKPQSVDNTKGNSQPAQPSASPSVQNVHSSPASRNPSAVNTPPVYPPYPNPYPYPYNYTTNPGFSTQNFSFSNHNQLHQSEQLPQNSSSGNNRQNPGQNQTSPYENSAYSAFHRPDASFQSHENPYSTPYPRPPYPNSGAPGFFPYNPPYPNYSYGHNFNPYMHPPGYGYPMQNYPPGNNEGLNPQFENVSRGVNANVEVSNAATSNNS